MITKSLAFVVASILPMQALADSHSSDVRINEIISEYAAECAKDGQSLEIDGDEVTELTTEQGKTAYVVFGEFACSEDGHLWCGTAGCPIDIVIDGRRYSYSELMRLTKKPPDFISIDADGSLTYGFRGTEFMWSLDE